MTDSKIKIGGFAELCRTSKDTLYLYDEAGLLKPRLVDPATRYRYYSADQFFEFDLINVLKAGGSSLKEIKGYLENLSPEGLNTLLSHKTGELQTRIRALKRQLAMLSQIKELNDHIAQLAFNKMEVVECRAQRFALKPCSVSLLADYMELSKSMAEFINEHNTDDTPLGFPMGLIADAKTVRSGKFTAYALFARSLDEGQGSEIFKAGRYLRCALKGRTEDHEKELARIFAYMDEHKLRPAGPLFSLDLLSWLQLRGHSTFATEYLIELE